MITSLVALTLSVQHGLPVAGLPRSSGASFYQVPCDFVRSLPFITLAIKTKGRDINQRFFLDSGANASFLFEDRPNTRVLRGNGSKRSLPLYIARKPKPVQLGSVVFAAVKKSTLNADFVRMLTKANVDGVLGADFFESNDIFISYADKRVSILAGDEKARDAILTTKTAYSQGSSSGDQARFEHLKLVGMGQKYAVISVVGIEKKDIALMILDTGADISTLPIPAGRTKPNGATASTLIGAHGNHTGWTEPKSVYITPAEAPFRIGVNYVGTADPVLAACDLGGEIIISFRSLRTWVKRSKK